MTFPWLTNQKRFKYVIGSPEDPMMIRYRLVETRWGELYMHHFLRSDVDRDLHDHPWDFISFILTTGYWEDRPRYPCNLLFCRGHEGVHEVYTVWHPPLSFNRKRAEESHRVDLPTGRTVWSLIWVSPKRRLWGFHTRHGWVEGEGQQ